MVQTTSFTGLFAAAALILAANAAPTENAAAPNIIYDRRSPNNALATRDLLAGRDSSSVSVTCYTQSDCTGQATEHSNPSFTGNTACINAPNCQCMKVTSINNAHIVYWNGQTCSGGKSVMNGCFSGGNVEQPSPGTNSIGFHVGCTGS